MWEGRRGGVGGGKRGRLHHTLEQKISRGVFMEVHAQTQFSYQVEAIVDNSFTSHVALLVLARRTTI